MHVLKIENLSYFESQLLTQLKAWITCEWQNQICRIVSFFFCTCTFMFMTKRPHSCRIVSFFNFNCAILVIIVTGLKNDPTAVSNNNKLEKWSNDVEHHMHVARALPTDPHSIRTRTRLRNAGSPSHLWPLDHHLSFYNIIIM